MVWTGAATLALLRTIGQHIAAIIMEPRR